MEGILPTAIYLISITNTATAVHDERSEFVLVMLYESPWPKSTARLQHGGGR